MFSKIKGFYETNKIKIMAACCSAVVGLFAVGVGASAQVTTPTTAPTISLTGVDFSPLVNAITSIVPEVMPVVVTVLGVRKAISFMMGCIRGC